MFTIDEIRIEGEEDGFHLIVHLAEGGDPDIAAIYEGIGPLHAASSWKKRNAHAALDRLANGPRRYRIGLPDQFDAEVRRTIGAWLAGGERARDSAPALNHWKDFPTDPKHPDYHDNMSALHDNREGK